MASFLHLPFSFARVLWVCKSACLPNLELLNHVSQLAIDAIMQFILHIVTLECLQSADP